MCPKHDVPNLGYNVRNVKSFQNMMFPTWINVRNVKKSPKHDVPNLKQNERNVKSVQNMM